MNNYTHNSNANDTLLLYISLVTFIVWLLETFVTVLVRDL